MKNLELNKTGIIAVVVAVLLGTVAGILAQTLPEQRAQRYNLAFPDTAGGKNHHEWRLLPERDTIAGTARLVVEELLLGPVQLGAVPFVPEGTAVRSVIYRRESRTLYVDFSSHLVVGNIRGNISIEEALDLITYNINRNIPRIEEIVMTVEGQLPGVPRFDTL